MSTTATPRRLCPNGGKPCYRSRAKARRTIPLLQGGKYAERYAGARVSEYRCPYCGFWHLTTEEPRNR